MTTLTTPRAVAMALTNVLQNITVANGYETDVGKSVTRGRLNIAENQVPCAVILESTDIITGRAGGRLTQNSVEQTYVIAVYVNCDPNNPSDAAHAAIADVKKAIFSSNFRQQVSAKYLGKYVGARADGRAIIFATVEISATYVEDLTIP